VVGGTQRGRARVHEPVGAADRGPRRSAADRFDRAPAQRERPSRREELSRLAREQARAATAPRPRAGDSDAAPREARGVATASGRRGRASGSAPARRTIEIRGQVAQRPAIAAVPDPVDAALVPARRRSRPRRSPAERFAAHPDRTAQWAFLLGLFLIFVAAVSAHG